MQRNLSNLTHQATREICQSVQGVGILTIILAIRNTLGPLIFVLTITCPQFLCCTITPALIESFLVVVMIDEQRFSLNFDNFRQFFNPELCHLI